MSALKAAQTLLQSILERIPGSKPLAPDALQAIVSATLANVNVHGQGKSTVAWDVCLKREVTGIVVSSLAPINYVPALGDHAITALRHCEQSRKAREGGPLDDAYFDGLYIRLDIALCCAEMSRCLPFYNHTMNRDK